MKRFFLCTFLLITAFIIGCTEDEPVLFGDIYGTVTDSKTGEPVRNAQVVLAPSGASTVSGSDGHFEFRSLDAGQYSISISSDGYESNSRQITVVPGQSVSCDILLTPKIVEENFTINPVELNFGTTQTQLAVTVTNDSPHDTQWSLDLGQNTWLKASPVAGQIGAGKTQIIVFSVNRVSLTKEESGIVLISALGSSSSLTVNCSPSQQASSIMEVTPLDIDFGDLSTEQVLRIKNKSNTLLNWTIYGIEEEAISVSDTSGVIQAGLSKVVAIKLDRSKLSSNQLTTSFMISDGENDQQVNVNVGSHESNVTDNPDEPTNEPTANLELPKTVLDFGLNYGVLPFTINNVGDETVDWSIVDVQDDIFTFAPESGTVEAGNSTEIQVSIDRENLPTGTGESAFAISDGVNKYFVTVIYEEPDYTDGKLQISTVVLDFGTTETLQTFDVKNTGSTYLSWTVTELPDYIHFSPGPRSNKQGQGSTIQSRVELNRETMPDEVDTFIVITNDYNPEDTHKVHILASKEGSNTPDYTKGLIQVSPTSIYFGTDETTATLFIKNIGTDWLEWAITGFPESGYLKMVDEDGYVYSGGAMIAGHTMDVNIVLDRDIMPDEVDTYVTVINKYNSEDTHQVRILATKQNTSASTGSKIYYASTDGHVIIPNDDNVFGANIISNTYVDGQGVITFDGDVTMIGNSAFYSCGTLSSITIPDSVTEIGAYAFRYCRSLTNITIPESVTTIGSNPFDECHDLSAFYGKFATKDNRGLVVDGTLMSFAPKGLTSYTIPGGVTKIGYYLFSNCNELTKITIPEGVETIDAGAFWGCSAITNLTIPESVTAIGGSAFGGCTNLSAFRGKFATEDFRCLIADNVLVGVAPKGLTSYSIPEGVTHIGAYAFVSSALSNVTIPSTVKYIALGAFYGCKALVKLHCKPTAPPELGPDVFYGAPASLQIYVPAGSVNTYKQAEGWSAYANCIAGQNF